MNITPYLIEEVRLKLGEGISVGGEGDSLFSDSEIIRILERSNSINEALYHLWVIKAGKVVKNAGEFKSVRVGGETLEFHSITDYVNYCLKMAEVYRALWDKEIDESKISKAMGFYAPKVANIEDE